MRRPFLLPTWAPMAAIAGILVWAAGIWWMVATLPTGGGDTAAIEDALDAVVAELESTDGSIEALREQVATLEEERDALVARVEQLEKSPVDEAFQMSPQGAETSEQASTAEAGVETTPAEGDPSTAATPPTTATPETSPYFTNGRDTYNCHHFTSKEEAQEAFEVNGPGDPNRIDTNGNGLACEDFIYSPSGVAVTPAVAQPWTTQQP